MEPITDHKESLRRRCVKTPYASYCRGFSMLKRNSHDTHSVDPKPDFVEQASTQQSTLDDGKFEAMDVYKIYSLAELAQAHNSLISLHDRIGTSGPSDDFSQHTQDQIAENMVQVAWRATKLSARSLADLKAKGQILCSWTGEEVAAQRLGELVRNVLLLSQQSRSTIERGGRKDRVGDRAKS